MSVSSTAVLNNFIRAINGDRPKRIPVVFCISSQYICKRFRVNVKDYLYNAETKLSVQCAFQDEYPEIMLVPGIYPDFGCGVVEPSAFGCKLVQREDNPLSPKPICPKALHVHSNGTNIQDALSIKMPDVHRDGLLPHVLEQYRYYWKHLDKSYIDQYGYLDGFAFSMGPVETTALIVGYENFLIGLHDFPKQIHELLNKVTEFIIHWLKTQEQINGKLKRIYIFDHTPARMSLAHFEEFVLPYISRVCAEFSSAIKIYHICDKRINHVLPRLVDMGINVLYFSADIAEVKKATGKRISLMGNLNPINLIFDGSPQQIIAEAKKCISIAHGEDGGYLLAPSGAFIAGTPTENIQAITDAVK